MKQTKQTDEHAYAVVDYNSKVDLGVASDEMRAKWQEAREAGKAFVELRISGVHHRVTVEKKPLTPAQARLQRSSTYGKSPPEHAPGAPRPDLEFLAEHGNAHARARAKEALTANADEEAATESELGLRWPHCHCSTSTLWSSRKLDGRWSMSADEPELEQRTCRACGASMSREIGR